MSRIVSIACVMATLAAGCAYETGAGADADAVGAQQEELVYGSPPRALAFAYAERDDLPHSVTADLRHVFVTEPLTGRVSVLRRWSGRGIAELPGPDGDPLILPFQVRLLGPNRLAVLDPGGLPDPSGPPPTPRIIEYHYETVRGRFTASVERVISLGGLPLIYTDDFVVLPDGNYALSESVIGAVWIVDSDSGVAFPGLFPASPDPASAIPEVGPCFTTQSYEVDGVPFVPPGGFLPGIGSITADDEYLYWGSACAGGLHRIPLASLTDGRLPFERAADIELISPRPSDDVLDVLKGFSIDIYNDPDAMYAADPFSLRVVRIDLQTGEREVIATDDDLFNFVVSTTILPPLGLRGGPTQLVTVADQEHRWTLLNGAIADDQFELPFIMTRVVVLGTGPDWN